MAILFRHARFPNFVRVPPAGSFGKLLFNIHIGPVLFLARKMKRLIWIIIKLP
jgi:hypothetical protein